MALYRNLIHYEEFVQRVRRHRPSDLLPAIASTALQFSDPAAWTAERIRTPWALAGAAKASIVAGNEDRPAGVTERDIIEICAAYNALEDPLTCDADNLSGTVGAFMVRLSHEQFLPQQSLFEEISRLSALFHCVDTLDTEILNSALIEQLLGCTLTQFVQSGFVIATGATKSAGFFDPNWDSLWHGPGAVNARFPMATVSNVFHQHFLTDFAQFRKTARRWTQSDKTLRQHEFNPLVSRPFVTLPDGRHIAPQPQYCFQRLSPAAVYYAGIERLNNVDADAFTRDIGALFQHYVGRQLGLLPNATVTPEIHYGHDQRSVDWFVIFDDLVLLIEAKTTRLSNLARMGGTALQGDLDRSLGRAFRQLRRTEQLIADGDPAFSVLPTDRPRIAIIATLEPYWSANSTHIRQLLPEPPLPVTVASIREVEHLVDVIRTHGGPQVLREVLADPDRRHWNLGNALPADPLPHNSILADAWAANSFPPFNQVDGPNRQH